MIRKALSGFYYVHTEDGRVLECRAKGVFRKEGITPLVGDQVEVENGVVSCLGKTRSSGPRRPISTGRCWWSPPQSPSPTR